MEVKYKVICESLYLYFDGELDEYSASKIREYIDRVIEENLVVKKVIFNLSSLKFMDSTGIGLLIGRYKKLNNVGIKSFIESPMPMVQRVLELSGLYGLMPKIG